MIERIGQVLLGIPLVYFGSYCFLHPNGYRKFERKFFDRIKWSEWADFGLGNIYRESGLYSFSIRMVGLLFFIVGVGLLALGLHR
ncbi:MAG: hypothetical protein C4321_10205 [Chloroflexota bacterium]